jgi:hypothetical protein
LHSGWADCNIACRASGASVTLRAGRSGRALCALRTGHCITRSASRSRWALGADGSGRTIRSGRPHQAGLGLHRRLGRPCVRL